MGLCVSEDLLWVCVYRRICYGSVCIGGSVMSLCSIERACVE